jgi:hypothetical protein
MFFAKSLKRAFRSDSRRDSARYTAVIVASAVLKLISAKALVGAVHRTVRAIEVNRPYPEKQSERSLRNLEGAIGVSLPSGSWDVALTRAA